MKQKRDCNDSGYVMFSAIAMIMCLSIIFSFAILLVSSSVKKTRAYKRMAEGNRETERVIEKFLSDFQEMRNEKNDRSTSEILEKILSDYSNYELKISDVSTGINEKILNEDFLKEESIKKLILLKGEKIQSSYGWINPHYAPVKLIKEVLSDYGKENTSDVFPQFSTLPYWNVFNMDDEFIKAIIEHFNIPDSERKTRKIRELINNDKLVSDREIRDILGVKESHSICDFLGLKTVFWRACAVINKEKVSLIIAAVPYRYENKREIERYIIVEREYERDNR